MSIRIPQLSLKGEPPVSASAAGAAGLRWSGRELPQTRSDWFVSQQIFLLAHPGRLHDSGLTDAAGATLRQASLAPVNENKGFGLDASANLEQLADSK